jgi:catechol 2,3-dioxygenase-like lactoylglutathione lyase family enzyme
VIRTELCRQEQKMHGSRLGSLVIDCQTDDLAAAAEFWAQALGYEVGDATGPYVDLVGPDGEVKVLVQKVEHEARVHLDIETDDQEAEASRLEALGAKRIAKIKRWIVLEAPSGHRFCVVNPQRKDFPDSANRWP